MPRVRVARASELAAARHHVTLRHADTNEYHSVLLYSFAGTEGTDYYCMEATCPHLGAPLENAHVEHAPDDVEDLVVVCPWHQYDFSLSTGESSTGLQSCVYGVTVDDGTVYIDTPTPDARWTVVDVRPVSEGASWLTSIRRHQERRAAAGNGRSRRKGAARRCVVRPVGDSAAGPRAAHAHPVGRARPQHTGAPKKGGVHALCG